FTPHTTPSHQPILGDGPHASGLIPGAFATTSGDISPTTAAGAAGLTTALPTIAVESSNVSKAVEEKERVVVRFAGDSGDGIQLAGNRFAAVTALIGNDLVTLPDFPAEIRAPAGTVAGVSAFQIHFASRDILTPGRQPKLVAGMNPAA